jgi:hypothetical protein
MEIELKDWYTAEQATARLTANSGREVDKNYVRSLARYGKVRRLKLGNASLYYRADVDPYIVEPQGTKSGRAKRQKAVEKKHRQQAAS